MVITQSFLILTINSDCVVYINMFKVCNASQTYKKFRLNWNNYQKRKKWMIELSEVSSCKVDLIIKSNKQVN